MRVGRSINGKAVVKTDAVFYAQVRDVFVQARQFVHKTANFAMVKAYWLVGKMIVEKQGGERAFQIVHTLCEQLSWSHLHNARIFAAKYKLLRNWTRTKSE